MQQHRGFHFSKIAAGIIGFLLLFAVLFSAFFIATETDHVCPEENCPICISIQQCEAFLQQFSHGSAILSVMAVPCLFLLFSIAVFTACYFRETPISQKVRLNI